MRRADFNPLDHPRGNDGKFIDVPDLDLDKVKAFADRLVEKDGLFYEPGDVGNVGLAYDVDELPDIRSDVREIRKRLGRIQAGKDPDVPEGEQAEALAEARRELAERLEEIAILEALKERRRGNQVARTALRAQMSASQINDLPDSAFAYIEPGGSKDDQGKTVPRSKRHFPIHDAAHVRNALARAPQSPFGDKAMPKIRAAAKKLDIEVSGDDADRSRKPDPIPYARSWALDDIEILRAADGYGDGRTVSAYAAIFDTPTEITDQHGHYMEVIARNAFNRQIGLGVDRVGVFYHHGMTIHGTPSDLGSVPIGSPIEIHADRKGLRTVTRFNGTPLAESVLEAIRHGDIKGYSFRGRIYESKPTRVPRPRSGSLPTITRTVLGLTEYGPTPSPAYAEAGILAIRALQAIASTTPGHQRSWTGPGQETPPVTPEPGPDGAEDQPDGHSFRLRQRQLALKRAMREREKDHGA